MQNTISFKEGKYENGLLWREDKVNLLNNRQSVVQRSQSLEKKLAKNDDLKTKYHKTVKHYIDNNHATKIAPEDLTPEKASTTPIMNYIPHHAASNHCKPDKVRVVYDAAVKYRNCSLSDHLLKGPYLLNNLVSIVIRFFLGLFAVTSDIEQMFHQVRVREEDRDALRFLWRENANDYIDDYKMNVHLFGKNDSPCVANFFIKQVAKDKCDTDHIVAKSIDEYFYMDDFIKSGNSLETFIYIITSVTNTLFQYGFRLHKWISKNEYLLNKIP